MSGTSVPARWTKHRPIAYAIAAEYRIPGLERQDVDQEACVALWLASRAYDRSKGSFPAFARLVIHRRLTDLVREATRQKRSTVTVTDVDVAAPNRSEAQLSLFSVLEVAATALTVHRAGRGPGPPERGPRKVVEGARERPVPRPPEAVALHCRRGGVHGRAGRCDRPRRSPRPAGTSIERCKVISERKWPGDVLRTPRARHRKDELRCNTDPTHRPGAGSAPAHLPRVVGVVSA